MGNWDLNPTYRCYNPIHNWSKTHFECRISHEHEWIFFPSPSEVTYKIQGGLRHVEFGAQLLCFQLLWNYHLSIIGKAGRIDTNSFNKKFTGIFTESPDILWQNLGPMTLISPPTWSWEASGFTPLVGRVGNGKMNRSREISWGNGGLAAHC